MGKTLLGKPVADAICDEICRKVRALGKSPCIATVGFSNNSEWTQYSGSLAKSAQKYFCRVDNHYFVEGVSTEVFFKKIDDLCSDETVDGILIQQPLPSQYRHAVLRLDPDKDVDGLTARNLQSLFCNKEVLVPATPLAVIKILEHYGVDLCGKNVVVIGRGVAVGKPLALMMTNRNATVTLCHTKTKDLPEIARRADVVVSCCGSANLVNDAFVNENSVVLDVGLSFVGGSFCGDVDFRSVSSVAAAVSPVPGGVGPVTRACLFLNALSAMERK